MHLWVLFLVIVGVQQVIGAQQVIDVDGGDGGDGADVDDANGANCADCISSMNNSEADFVDLEFVDVHKNHLINFHKHLVEIESITSNETAVALFLKEYLESAGLTVELQEVAPKRFNVYSYYGSQRDNTIVVTSHIDTVPPFIPYSVDGSKIYGRGSCDAKGSVAAQVFAVLSLIKSGEIRPGTASLLFVVGEEVDGLGMLHSDQLGTKWDVGIFGEPTELKLGVGHKGGLLVDIAVDGVACHSGYPELGVSATEILIPALNRLLEQKWPVNELLGPTTVNIGKIDAGVAHNVVPPRAEAGAFFRISDDSEPVKRAVESALGGVDRLSYNISFESRPQYLDYDIPGFETIVLAYATDIPHMQQHLSKRYLYGPGTIHVAHSDHEFVEVDDLVLAVEGYANIIRAAMN